jgi:hypothetical protein
MFDGVSRYPGHALFPEIDPFGYRNQLVPVDRGRVQQDLVTDGRDRRKIGPALAARIRLERDLPGRPSGAFEISMSALLSGVEGGRKRVVCSEEQQVWMDPETHYTRRAVSPPAGSPLQIVEVELPPAREGYVPGQRLQISPSPDWILAGHLRFTEGRLVHDLHNGDCLQLGYPEECTCENPSPSRNCRYLVATVVRQE